MSLSSHLLCALFMLLHFILFLYMVCTTVICEFHAFLSSFLCVSQPLEFLFLALIDAKNNFSVPVLVVSLCMPQIRGSFGHLKGNYDSHLSCLNCSGCSRFNLRCVPLLVRLYLGFGWKASAVPRQANGQDEGSESEEAEEFRF